MGRDDIWISLFLSIMIIICSVLGLGFGEISWRDVVVPQWELWPLLFIGIIICIISIRAIQRGEGKKKEKKYTDADAENFDESKVSRDEHGRFDHSGTSRATSEKSIGWIRRNIFPWTLPYGDPDKEAFRKDLRRQLNPGLIKFAAGTLDMGLLPSHPLLLLLLFLEGYEEPERKK